MKGKTTRATVALIILIFMGLFLPLSTTLAQLVLPPLPIEGTSPSGGNSQNTGTAPGYGGYGEGSNVQINLPSNLGTVDLGVSSSGINSSGGMVNDWPGTPQDESKATVVSEVETLGVHRLAGSDVLNFSLGSAGSSYPPSTGIIGSVQEISVPGAGQAFAGYYQTVSTKDSAQSQISVLLVRVEALNLNLAIPLLQSSSAAKKEGTKVSSDATSDAVASDPDKPLVIGKGLVNGSDAVSVKLINAKSHSEADGAAAGSSSSWNLVNLAAAGIPVITVDSQSGAMFAGATLIPAPGGKSLLVVEPVPGIIGIFVGETWSNTDGKSFAYGGANVLRISLLDKDNFLVLGHAGTGANATYSDGPGAGPDREKEGYGNQPSDLYDPPNDVPIGFVAPADEVKPESPNDIGPGDNTKEDEPANIGSGPGPALAGDNPGGTTAAETPSGGGLTRSVLPLTGMQSILLLAVFAALSGALALKLDRRRKSGLASVLQAPIPVKVAAVRVDRHDDRELPDLQPVNGLGSQLRPGDGFSRNNLLREQGAGPTRSRHIYAPVRVKRRRRFFA